jgi:hypothetical protein
LERKIVEGKKYNDLFVVWPCNTVVDWWCEKNSAIDTWPIFAQRPKLPLFASDRESICKQK